MKKYTIVRTNTDVRKLWNLASNGILDKRTVIKISDFETKIMELGVGSSGATKVDKIKTNKVGRFYRMLPVYTCTKCNDKVTVKCGLSKGKVMARCYGCEKVQIFEPTKNVEILFYDYNIK